MKPILLTLLLSGSGFPQLLFGADTAKDWKVEVAGLRVTTVAPDNQGLDWELGRHEPSVTVLLKLTAPAGAIVTIKADESKLDSFTDNLGADLMAGRARNSVLGEPGVATWTGNHPLVLGGNRTEFISVTSAAQPSQGAMKIALRGNVLLQIAEHTNQFVAESVELKPGAKFSLGKMEWEVADVEGHGGSVVSLQTAQDFSSLVGIDFYDQSGIKIRSHLQGARYESPGWEKHGTLKFQLNRGADKVKIVVTCWSDLKKQTVPISVETGMGL
jgi:hypothetical protein